MNCSRFQNAVLPKKCGIPLKSALMDKGESIAESFSSESRKEVCIMKKGE